MKSPFDFFPKKHLGQHFLVDQRTTERIISECQFNPDDIILEIGPGWGVLTYPIASKVKKVIAIEMDPRLCESLKRETKNTNIEVVQADFLKYDFDLLPEKLKVIANLPYYISSPVIERIINQRQRVESAFVTVQLEFGQRLCAKVDTKEYGALSCFVQYFADVKLLFKIKKTAFKPIPKVDSCFMKIVPYENVPLKADDEKALFKIIRQAFQQRRKTLPNALRGLIERERLDPILESLKIDPKSRPENLSVKDFVDLVNALGSHC